MVESSLLALNKQIKKLGNASSLHSAGRSVRKDLETAREELAVAVGCDASEIIFTATGTEANNLAIKGLFWKGAKANKKVIITSTFEHHAVMDPINWLTEHEGAQVIAINVDRNGFIDLALLLQEIEKHHSNVHAEIIEKDLARAEFIAGELKNTLVLQGDALDSEVLYEANINVAETVVAVTEDERVNTLASLLSKRLGASRALCLINNTLHAPLVTSLGVDAVISPKKVTVSKILQNIRRGRIRSVHSLGESFGEIIEAEAQESSGLIGSLVSDINSPHEIIVAAIIRQEEVIIPMPSTAIKLEDRIILMVTPAAISKIEKLFSSRLDYY